MTYKSLLKIKVKYYYPTLVVSLLIMIFLILSNFIYIYDVDRFASIITNQTIAIETNNYEVLKTDNLLYINDQRYNYSINKIELLNNKQKVWIKIDNNNFLNNQGVYIAIKYNKEKAIKKIMKQIF